MTKKELHALCREKIQSLRDQIESYEEDLQFTSNERKALKLLDKILLLERDIAQFEYKKEFINRLHFP